MEVGLAGWTVMSRNGMEVETSWVDCNVEKWNTRWSSWVDCYVEEWNGS